MILINKIRFIDLFAGIGGFRIGLEKNKFECVYSVEKDKHCKETYYKNFGEKPKGDIKKIDAEDVPNHDVLCAGFPCQPFSISGKRLGFEDTRGTLFFDILRIAKEKRPKVLFLENVRYLTYHNDGETFDTMIKLLEELNYTVSWKVLNANNFGVPQNRERVIIIASQNGKKFDFKKLENKPRPAIKDILDSEGEFEYLDESEYVIIDNPTLQKRSGMKFIGYRDKNIRKKGANPENLHLSRVHRQPNRIYSAEGTHPTLNAQETSGRYFIYINNKVRKLTINECFKVQGFPEDFKKVSSKTQLYKQIGNSISPKMVKFIGKEIKKQLFDIGESIENESYSNIAVNL